MQIGDGAEAEDEDEDEDDDEDDDEDEDEDEDENEDDIEDDIEDENEAQELFGDDAEEPVVQGVLEPLVSIVDVLDEFLDNVTGANSLPHTINPTLTGELPSEEISMSENEGSDLPDVEEMPAVGQNDQPMVEGNE